MKAVLFTVLALTATATAGDLNPPPGPVDSTMKTLDEVEPRTAINAENTPGNATATFVITRSGSYYLTDRFDSPDGRAGIRVLANNVTIDLNGFDIFGDTDGEPGSPSAVGIDASLASGVWIRNGRIWNFNGEGIVTGDRALLENLEVRRCSDDGFSVGDDSALKDCVTFDSGARGFRGGSGVTFTACVSNGSAGAGFSTNSEARFDVCTARDGQSDGFMVANNSTVISCRSSNNSGAGYSGAVNGALSDCTAEFNGGHGYLFTRQLRANRCRSIGNIDAGYSSTDDASFNECVARDNRDAGFETNNGVSATACESIDNDGDGFSSADHGHYERCVAIRNSADGFSFGDHTELAGCVARSNMVSGIVGSDNARLVDCVASDHTADEDSIGIDLRDSGSVLRCVANGNLTNGFDVRTTLIEGCSAEGNLRHGFVIRNGSTARVCSAINNGDTGFLLLFDDNVATDCTSVNNGNADGAGFRGGFVPSQGVNNVVIGCSSTRDNNGVRSVSASDSTVVKNIVRDAVVAGYSISNSGNAVGTIQTSPVGAGPWDNFDY